MRRGASPVRFAAAAPGFARRRCSALYCHLMASVDIIGGRTGLLSSTRSRSIITAPDSLGTICWRATEMRNKVQFKNHSSSETKMLIQKVEFNSC